MIPIVPLACEYAVHVSAGAYEILCIFSRRRWRQNHVGWRPGDRNVSHVLLNVNEPFAKGRAGQDCQIRSP